MFSLSNGILALYVFFEQLFYGSFVGTPRQVLSLLLGMLEYFKNLKVVHYGLYMVSFYYWSISDQRRNLEITTHLTFIYIWLILLI